MVLIGFTELFWKQFQMDNIEFQFGIDLNIIIRQFKLKQVKILLLSRLINL